MLQNQITPISKAMRSSAYGGIWRYGCGEANWYTSDGAISETKVGLSYCATNGPQLDVLGFGWCWDMSWMNGVGGGTNTIYGTRWAGSSEGGPDGNQRWGLSAADYPLTGNHVCMDTYLSATEQYRSYCASNGYSTKVIFTTGPVDGIGANELGYQTALKNQYIRDYVANTSDGILFDYADILCWDDAGTENTASWENFNGALKTFSAIAPDNMLDLGGGYAEDGDHIGQRGALRLAKAMWWMLAKMSEAQDSSLMITNCSVNLPNVSLGWTTTSNQYIVARSDNLATGRFDFVGSVLFTNRATVTSDIASAFFGIREVTIVDVPDPELRNIISNSIVHKFEPVGLYYDIDLSGIDSLYADGRGISNAVGLNGCTDLTYLDVSSNALASLDVSGLYNLEELYCYNNQITNLNLSGCTNLSVLYCMNNPLGALDFSGMASLRVLWCYVNGLTNLNLTGCTNLTELFCVYNPLGALDVSGLSSLSTLYCYVDGLTNLNLTGCTNLTRLACNDNLLSVLDLTGFYALTNLFCNNNNLGTLDISACTNLTIVQCMSNSLVDVASFVTNASRGGLGTGDVVYLIGNPLSQWAITNQIPSLKSFGVTVYWP